MLHCFLLSLQTCSQAQVTSFFNNLPNRRGWKSLLEFISYEFQPFLYKMFFFSLRLSTGFDSFQELLNVQRQTTLYYLHNCVQLFGLFLSLEMQHYFRWNNFLISYIVHISLICWGIHLNSVLATVQYSWSCLCILSSTFFCLGQAPNVTQYGILCESSHVVKLLFSLDGQKVTNSTVHCFEKYHVFV